MIEERKDCGIALHATTKEAWQEAVAVSEPQLDTCSFNGDPVPLHTITLSDGRVMQEYLGSWDNGYGLCIRIAELQANEISATDMAA
jgi:hypothetical protein